MATSTFFILPYKGNGKNENQKQALYFGKLITIRPSVNKGPVDAHPDLEPGHRIAFRHEIVVGKPKTLV